MLDPVECFAALGEPQRFTLFLTIIRNPGKDRLFLQATHPEIKDAWSPTSTWHHLQVLAKSGLVTKDVLEKKDVRYYVSRTSVLILANYLKGTVIDHDTDTDHDYEHDGNPEDE